MSPGLIVKAPAFILDFINPSSAYLFAVAVVKLHFCGIYLFFDQIAFYVTHHFHFLDFAVKSVTFGLSLQNEILANHGETATFSESTSLLLSADEDQETSGDFGSGGAVILLDDQEEEPSQSGRSRQKKRRGRIHPRGAIEDDEDGEDDKDDELGYAW